MITLPRTGKRPLRFDGELIAESSGASNGINRWHDLSLYRVSGGGYVVVIEYLTQWQGELGHTLAEFAPTAEAVAGILEGYDPTQFLAGYPPGEHFAEKQKRLRRDIRLRYEKQVSELLSAPEFAEELEAGADAGADIPRAAVLEIYWLFDRLARATLRAGTAPLLDPGAEVAAHDEADYLCDQIERRFEKILSPQERGETAEELLELE